MHWDTNNWIYVDNDEKIDKVFDALINAEVLGIDTETTGLNPYDNKLRLLQIAAKNSPTVIFDCFKILPNSLDKIRKILDSNSVKVFQNAKFDLQFLMSEGIEVSGHIFDTMLAAQLLRTSGGPRRASLAIIAQHYLNVELPKEEQLSDFSKDLTQSQLNYAAKDASILLELREIMIPELMNNHLVESARLEFACVYCIADIEYNGIYLDVDKWKILSIKIQEQKADALEELYPYIGYPNVQVGMFDDVVNYGFNLDSNKQVLRMLNDNNIMVENTSKHSLSQHKNNLIVKSLLKYRHAAKALSSFLYSIPKQINQISNRLHPHYSQIGAWSGRMSCGGPNIQQIPRDKEFRDCFTAPRGRKLVIADYSQIELRVIAQISRDKRMITAYRNGEDLHALTASLISGKKLNEITKTQRQAAKAVNFGLVFGMGAAGLKDYSLETYGVEMTLDQATVFKQRFFEAYRGVEDWHTRIKKELPNSSRTLAGRKHVYNENSGISGRYNTPVQGTAADILKNALGMLHLQLSGTTIKVIAVVHDEIILECDENQSEYTAKLLRETMEDAGYRYMNDVPCIAESSIADSWAEK